jgi:hypothetical protein
LGWDLLTLSEPNLMSKVEKHSPDIAGLPSTSSDPGQFWGSQKNESIVWRLI